MKNSQKWMYIWCIWGLNISCLFLLVSYFCTDDRNNILSSSFLKWFLSIALLLYIVLSSLSNLSLFICLLTFLCTFSPANHNDLKILKVVSTWLSSYWSYQSWKICVICPLNFQLMFVWRKIYMTVQLNYL